MLFQDRLYQLRKGRGISQEELAAVVGVSRQAVQKWESGASRPDMDNLVALGRYFHVTLDYLVLGQESEPVPDPVLAEAPRLCPWCYEYKSRRTLLGLPLVHVKLSPYGVAWARGVVAVGNCATGVFALGGFSAGLLSLGGVSVGLLLSLGGIAAGLAALGGLAVGVVAVGGLALGGLAAGGVACGQYAAGGVASAVKLAVGDSVKGLVAVGRDCSSPPGGLSIDWPTLLAQWRSGSPGGPSLVDTLTETVRQYLPATPVWLIRLLLRIGI